LGIAIMTSALPSFNSIFGLELSTDEMLTRKFILFMTLLIMGLTLMAGSYPGIILARIAPLLALKGKLTARDAGSLFTRKVLVTVQFAISIILIIGTIGVNKQIDFAIHSDLGYDKSAIVMIPLPFRLEPAKLENLKEQIVQLSGVEKATACFASPGAAESDWGSSLKFNNNPETEEFSIQAKMADQDYLKTFDLKLIAGRNFYEKDSVDEILVNEIFVKKVNANSPEDLLGKTFEINGFVKGTIVGVVNDFHDQDFHEKINPIFIAPVKNTYNEFAIKINMNDAATVLNKIQEQWSTAFPDYIFEYDFLEDRVNKLYESEQRFLALTKLFSTLAICIGCLGIYGLILFFVVQKTREIGIRKVLGGSVTHILLLVSQDFLKLLILAAIIASPIAWYLLDTWLQNFNYKTEISWWVFILATVIVAFITLLTITYQAMKAAFANPVNSLKSE
jgi:putative ABC transport system permease protein